MYSFMQWLLLHKMVQQLYCTCVLHYNTFWEVHVCATMGPQVHPTNSNTLVLARVAHAVQVRVPGRL